MSEPKRPYLALQTLTVRLDGASSLKDKRTVLRSLKDGLRSRFGVSAVEVDGLDEPGWAVLNVAGLATSRPQADALLARFENHVERRLGGLDLELEGEVVEL